jgi:hypothetical protein
LSVPFRNPPFQAEPPPRPGFPSSIRPLIVGTVLDPVDIVKLAPPRFSVGPTTPAFEMTLDCDTTLPPTIALDATSSRYPAEGAVDVPINTCPAVLICIIGEITPPAVAFENANPVDALSRHCSSRFPPAAFDLPVVCIEDASKSDECAPPMIWYPVLLFSCRFTDVGATIIPPVTCIAPEMSTGHAALQFPPNPT